MTIVVIIHIFSEKVTIAFANFLLILCEMLYAKNRDWVIKSILVF